MVALYGSVARGQTTWTKVLEFDNVGGIVVDCADSTDCVLSVFTYFANTVLRTSSGGRTWDTVFVEHDDSVSSPYPWRTVQHPTRDLIVAASSGGFIIRSSDRGRTWTRTHLAGDNGELLSFCDSLNGIVCFSGAGVSTFVTTDGGVRWTPIQISRPTEWESLTAFPFDLKCIAPGVFLASVAAPNKTGAIVRSTDYGRTWQAKHPVVSGLDTVESWWLRISDPHPNHVIAQGNRLVSGGAYGPFYILSSADSGDSWMPVIDQVPPYGRIWFTSFRDSLNGLGGGPLNIYSTTDGGRTWTMELDTFAGFTQVYFERGVPGLALSRSRGTVYVRSTGTSAVRESAAARPIRHLPSNALEVTPGSSGKVIVTVADVRGAVRVRRVQSAVAGSPLYLDLNGLPPGFYVVSVTGNGESAVGKVAIAP